MKKIALAAITFYQRFISPHKGFSCAFHAYTGKSSCSTYGYRAIARHGIFAGVMLIRRRLERCGDAYRKHARKRESTLRPSISRGSQAGFCDAGCAAGACGASDMGACSCDALSGCTLLSCDFEDWGRRKKDEDRYVEIGPGPASKFRKARR